MTVRRYIRAGWLVDGSGEPVQKDRLLTVEDGIITAIGPFSPVAGGESEVVDLSFATLLPPLIDCHLHLAMSGTIERRERERLVAADCEELLPVIDKNVTMLAAHGVLAVRDGGDRHNCVLRYLDTTPPVGLPVHIESPGKAWHRQGRYGAIIGHSPTTGESLADGWVRSPVSSGYIKLVNSGLNSLTTYGRETPPQFTVDEIRALVALSTRHGRKVMVHANGRLPVQMAIEAGCHSIEHGFFMGEENLALMAERGCVWVPTVCTMKAYADLLDYERDYNRAAVARKNQEHQLGQLRLARRLGVKVALGTDAGSPGVLHGESVFEEMKLFAKAGYPLAEIVHCATLAGARLMGLPDRGLLAPGRSADFLVARGAPAQLPRKLSYLEGIYIRGELSAHYRKNPVKPSPSAG
ncbi:MAG: amidohydrolase family protein [Desulfopila sp.]